MSNVIHLRDNDYHGTTIPQGNIGDIQRIADYGCLQDAPELLVFPHSFKDLTDGIGDLSILTLHDKKYEDGVCVSAKAHTGNLMGFVGINGTSVSIHSRFTHKKEDGEVDPSIPDYFLYYMLQRVLSINVFSLEHALSREDKIIDFLLFLFPRFLKKALSQGLYKEYRRFQYDDDRVRGTIDVNRFIRNDIPFRGKISYTTREHSYDNPITQLVRHTIEYIKRHPFGSVILNNDTETKDAVSKIVMATPTYAQRDRQRVLNANMRPKVHPYFTEYKPLQLLCVRILRHESLRYGKEEDQIYGVLFDGAWLWEEYLNTVLKPLGFQHPENKLKRGGFKMFEKPEEDEKISANSRRLYPDFYKEDYIKEDYIIDAKYKRLTNGVGREDLYQVVTYMHCTKAKYGGYIYPHPEGQSDEHNISYRLTGYNGTIKLMPVKIPQIVQNDHFSNFARKMEDSEKLLSAYMQAED